MSGRLRHSRPTRAGQRRGLALGLLCAALIAPAAVRAAGTQAGTLVSNRASAVYTQGGTSHSMSSNVTIFAVDDKVSFTLTAADAANVPVTPGGRAYMTYVLTNTGNAPHDFTLASAPSGTPTLAPASGPSFYADGAGTTPLPTDANAGGLPYLTAVAPDASKTVYLYIVAPSPLTDGQSTVYDVTAEAYQPGNLGSVNPPVKSSTRAAADAGLNKNANMTTALVLLADGHGNGGDADRDGRYAVIAGDAGGNPIGFKAKSAAVNIVKSAQLSDPFGTSEAVSGATIHYTLAVTAAGSGTALGVAITDPIPANTTYSAGTLKLNGVALTDAADADAGEVTGAGAGTVTVRLGDLSAVTPAQTITFDVKIN